jgi:hypothetical protein
LLLGLLAGLWEFPTLDLVPPPPTTQKPPADASDSENEPPPRLLLSTIPSTIFPKLLAPSSLGAKLTPPKHIGSVPHIFSHIHKTYEVVCSTVVWHSDQPPELGVLPESNEKLKKGLNPKRKRADNQNGGEYVLPALALWVPRDEVMNQKCVLRYSPKVY